MSLVIRQASLHELPPIMEFSRLANDASITYAPMGYNAVIWRQTLKQVMADPSNVVLIAKREATVVGLLVGQKMPMPWCGGFCASDLVFTAFQGGDILLDAFVAWCIAKKIRRIDMGVSEPGQLEAKDRLFASAGFSQAGRVYYRIMETL